MRPYFLSIGAGLLVGVVYGLLNVRSPAPPVIALVGLFGILLGEQVVPVGKTFLSNRMSDVAHVVADCREHIFGQLPQRGRLGVRTDPAPALAQSAPASQEPQ